MIVFLPLNASIKVVSVFGDIPEAAEETICSRTERTPDDVMVMYD